MVEEVEHKTVAFDAYQACYGDYWPRAFGVIHGSVGVLGLGLIGMFHALREQGQLRSPRGWWACARELALMAYKIGPFLVRAMLPNFDPRIEREPQWVQDWVDGYARAPEGTPLPLVDTNDADMAVPFSGHALA